MNINCLLSACMHPDYAFFHATLMFVKKALYSGSNHKEGISIPLIDFFLRFIIVPSVSNVSVMIYNLFFVCSHAITISILFETKIARQRSTLYSGCRV